MDKVIVYLGDHHPPEHRVSDAFCQENLIPIKRQLREALTHVTMWNDHLGFNYIGTDIFGKK